MINAMPGMGGQQMPQGITPEMLANPQFLAMLRAQMGGGVGQPRMGGGGGGGGSFPGMQQQASAGGGIFGAGGMGQLAQFLRPYMQQQPQQPSKFDAPVGADKSTTDPNGAKPQPMGLLGQLGGLFQGAGDAKGAAPAPGGLLEGWGYN